MQILVKIRVLTSILVSHSLLFSCSDTTSKNYRNAKIAFLNVNVISMESEDVLSDQTVLVGDKSIIAIGSSDKIQPPENIVQIDARGKYLLPGLAEMHAHIPVPQEESENSIVEETLFLYIANGITTIRGMLGNPYHLELKEKVLKGEILGPRIYTSGPSLNGRSVQTKEVASTMVKEQKQAGYDFLKLHPGIKLDVFNEIVKTANEVGIKFAGHVSTSVGVRRAIEAGYATIDHTDGYLEGLVPTSANADPSKGGFFGFNFTDLADPKQIPDLAKATKEANVWVVPTQSLMERMPSPDDPEMMAKESEMRYMSPATIKQWVGRKKRLLENENYDEKTAIKFIETRRHIIKALHDAGAGILLGSDSPQIFNVPGFSIHHELKTLIESGLTSFEALQAGTANPAVFFNAKGQYGTITEGADADLILLNANPLTDLENLKQREGVMVRGRWMSENTIQERLKNIADKYKEMK